MMVLMMVLGLCSGGGEPRKGQLSLTSMKRGSALQEKIFEQEMVRKIRDEEREVEEVRVGEKRDRSTRTGAELHLCSVSCSHARQLGKYPRGRVWFEAVQGGLVLSMLRFPCVMGSMLRGFAASLELPQKTDGKTCKVGFSLLFPCPSCDVWSVMVCICCPYLLPV